MKKNKNKEIAGTDRIAFRLLAVLFCPGVFLAQPLLALETDFELEAGAAYSTNITRVDASQDIDELAATAGFTLNLTEKSKRLDLNAQSTVTFVDYQDDTFDSETLSYISATALIRISEQNFSWFFAENQGQVIVDPLQAATPLNRENINFFTTGPRFNLPLGTRTSLKLNGSFSDVQYEDQPLDNIRFGGSIGLERELSENRSLSLIVDANRIEYDDAPPNPPVDRQSAYLEFRTSAARNQLSLALGWNQVERAGIKGDGLLAELVWTREISAQSTFSLQGGTRFSDSGDIFKFNQSLDNQRGGTGDVQNVDDPFRLDTASVRYTYNQDRVRFSVFTFYEKENYESRTDLDRDRSGITLSLTRDLTRTLNGGLFAIFSNRDYANNTRNDDDTNFGFRFAWDFTRTLGLNFRVERFKRDSDDSSFDYEENRAYLSLVFRPGKK